MLTKMCSKLWPTTVVSLHWHPRCRPFPHIMISSALIRIVPRLLTKIMFNMCGFLFTGEKNQKIDRGRVYLQGVRRLTGHHKRSGGGRQNGFPGRGQKQRAALRTETTGTCNEQQAPCGHWYSRHGDRVDVQGFVKIRFLPIRLNTHDGNSRYLI